MGRSLLHTWIRANHAYSFQTGGGANSNIGNLAYQILGQEPKYASAGKLLYSSRGTPHKFWAVGNEDLHMKGWIHPANSIVFYLSSVFAAQVKSGKENLKRLTVPTC